MTVTDEERANGIDEIFINITNQILITYLKLKRKDPVLLSGKERLQIEEMRTVMTGDWDDIFYSGIEEQITNEYLGEKLMKLKKLDCVTLDILTDRIITRLSYDSIPIKRREGDKLIEKEEKDNG